MTKEQGLIAFLHEKVFDPILNSKETPANIKSGVNLTIGRMNSLVQKKWCSIFGQLLQLITQ